MNPRGESLGTEEVSPSFLQGESAPVAERNTRVRRPHGGSLRHDCFQALLPT